MPRRFHRTFCRVACVFLAAVPALLTSASRADDVVGTCDEAGLRAALESGGVITFECDGTIVVSNTLSISGSITLDANGHRVIITSPGGTNGVRLFTVEEGASLQLIRLQLVGGASTNGGAVFVGQDGVFVATDCFFSNNVARGMDGTFGRGSASGATATGLNGGDGNRAASGTNAVGGAVYNLGASLFTGCTFVTNSVIGGAGGDGGAGSPGTFAGGNGGPAGRGGGALGGAIFNAGTVSITNCTFQLNQAVGGRGGTGGTGGGGPFTGLHGRGGAGGPASGAALYNTKVGVATVVSSTFTLNGTSSGDSEAGENSTSSGKSGPTGPETSGGAIANYGTNVLVNCTLFANAAIGGNGGGGGAGTFAGGKGGQGGSAWGGNVFSGGRLARLTAINCTFSDGSAIGGTNGLGGSGPFVGKAGRIGYSRGANVACSNGVFSLKNCILAYPTGAGTNGYGKFKDDGFNLSSDRSVKFLRTSGSLTNLDPKLDILRDNGGPVQTIELLAGSPAIDAGDPGFCLDADARGVTRPHGGRCDIGAYESGLRLLAPVIVTPPSDQTAQPGGNVTFHVVVSGDPPLRLQWQNRVGTAGFEDIAGATNNSLALVNVDAADEGDYRVVASNNSGSVSSTSGALTLLDPPSITTDPVGVAVESGDGFTLTAAASGGEPLRYQWLTNGVAIPGAILDHYTVDVALPKDDADYQVRVCNDLTCVDSAVASVSVHVSAPAITTDLFGTVVARGGQVTLSVDVSGGLPLTYVWRRGSTLSSVVLTESNVLSRTSSLVLPNAQISDSTLYQVTISNTTGAVTSSVVMVNVQTTGPSISVQPVGATLLEGTNYTLSVQAGGSLPLTYQWRKNGTPIPGATSATLTFSSIAAADAATYVVAVGNAVATVNSAGAVVNVQLVPPVITSQPADVNGFTGGAATFLAGVSGSSLHYQWFFNSSPLLNSTNVIFAIPNLQGSNSGIYQVVVTNVAGGVTSAPAVLTVTTSAPVILAQPQSTASNAGTNFNATFTISAVGSQPLRFQWLFNDTPLMAPATTTFSFTNPASGSVLWVTNRASGSTLTITQVQPADEGAYSVIATNSLGAVLSDQALLDVLGFGVGN